jgi:hypothetical protein
LYNAKFTGKNRFVIFRAAQKTNYQDKIGGSSYSYYFALFIEGSAGVIARGDRRPVADFFE